MMIKKLLLFLFIIFFISPCMAQIETMDEESRIKLNQDLRYIERRIDDLQNSDVNSLGSPADDSLLLGNGSSWDISALPNCATADSSILQYSTTSNSFSCSVQGSSGPEVFTSDDTFTAPTGITKIFLTMCGGGGGGGGSGGAATGGGGGGGGQCLIKYPYTVVPDSSYLIDIGDAGVGGTGDNNGTAGEATYFDTGGGNLPALGGGAGLTAGNGGAGGGNINGSGLTAGMAGITGGTGATTANADGAGGAGCLLGFGGAGVLDGNDGTDSTGYCSGGGGAGNGVAWTGGSGADGIVIVEY